MSNQKEIDKIVDCMTKKEKDAKVIHKGQTSQNKIDELIKDLKK